MSQPTPYPHLPPDDQPPAGLPLGPPAAVPFGGPGFVPAPQTVPTTDTSALWALICAIGSWLLLPVVLAVVALVLASSADRSITQSQGWRTGSGLVTATRVLAWVNLAAALLAGVFVVALLVGLAVGG